MNYQPSVYAMRACRRAARRQAEFRAMVVEARALCVEARALAAELGLS